MQVIGGNKWKQHLEKIAKQSPELHVGILEGATTNEKGYENGQTVAEVAFWNEYGNQNIPARPFLRNSVKMHKTQWISEAKELIGNNLENMQVAFEALGEIVKVDIQKTIESGSFNPLAESTIQRKKKLDRYAPEKPLLDTTLLQNSISFEVKK